MPARKPYSQWDQVWVAEEVEALRGVRLPPRLGRRRPIIERVKLWMAAHRLLSQWCFGIALVASAVLTIMAIPMLEHRLGEWVRPVGFVLMFVGAYGAFMILSFGTLDLQSVYAAHLRTRAMRDNGDMTAAREVAERRQYWALRLKNMGTGNAAFRLMMRSTTTRVFMCLFASYFFFAKMTDPTRSKLPRSMSNWNDFRVFLGMAAAAIAFVGVQFLLWHRLKRRLRMSLVGTECPDCGYELEPGTRARAGPDVAIMFGPARCPECGCPWPLVPPPVGREP